MSELQRLRADHAPAVLAFELANRAYFAASISDRGDEYFEHFADRHALQLHDQAAGECAYYVLVADHGEILGRFNLFDLADGTANLGYRVAQQAAGKGLATATVRELCRLAATEHGLRTLRAGCSDANRASRRVLIKAGFTATGPAEFGGRPGTWFELDLRFETVAATF